MIYFILKITDSEDSLSCQNITYFNCSTQRNNRRSGEQNKGIKIAERKRSRAIEQSEMALLPRPAGCGGDGWCSVVVSIEACGKPFFKKERLAKESSAGAEQQRASGPSSNLGTGPISLFFKPLAKACENASQEESLGKRSNCFAVAGEPK